jgi:hypothetical protein
MKIDHAPEIALVLLVKARVMMTIGSHALNAECAWKTPL